jgi:tetratricopeptide (TPR) repeat protein
MSLNDTILGFRRLLWRLFRRTGPPPGVTPTDAGELFDRGMEFIRQGQCRKALGVARTLHRYRYTGAWEVEAAALQELGESDKAIEALRRGIEKVPVWRNGHLLAIYLSDAGRYDEALDAFEASMTMYEPRYVPTTYNKAIALQRAGRTDEAISLLQELAIREPSEDEEEALALATDYLQKLTTGARVAPIVPRRSGKRPSRRWRRS